jgi:hypothetical protein
LKGDWSTGEHDEGEGCVGAVEASCAADDQSYDAVEAFGAAVVDAQSDGGGDSVAVFADGAGGFDERG